MINDYIRICRLSHWIKNIFIIPGTVCAILLHGHEGVVGWHVVLGYLAMAIASSANYAINEYVDRGQDVHHPHKKHRPAVHDRITPHKLMMLYGALVATCLSLGLFISLSFTLVVGVFLLSGIAYNIPPLKLKNITFMDVIAESFNNPIRFFAGWVLITSHELPPSSIVVGYWFAGAFLMNSKRFNEYVSFNDKEQLARYRKSFRHYSLFSLSFLNMFYASMAMFFMGIFLFKHRLEYLLFTPFLAILFAYYHSLGVQPFSHQQAPQHIIKDTRLMLLCILTALVFIVTSWVDIPQMAWFATK